MFLKKNSKIFFKLSGVVSGNVFNLTVFVNERCFHFGLGQFHKLSSVLRRWKLQVGARDFDASLSAAREIQSRWHAMRFMFCGQQFRNIKIEETTPEIIEKEVLKEK